MDVAGCYYTFTDNKNARKFILDDDSSEKIIEIFEYIEDKIGFDVNYYNYNGKHGECFKTEVTNKTCFTESNDKTYNTLPIRGTNYNCKILL